MKSFIKTLKVLFVLICCTLKTAYAQVPLVSSGTGNNFVVQFPGNITAVPAGLSFTFFSNQNIIGTSGATLSVNGTTAKPIFKNVNQNLAAGDIIINQAVTVIYDNNGNWQMISKDASSFPASVYLWTVSGINTSNFPLSNNVGIGTSTPQTTLDVNGILNLPLGTIGGIHLNNQKWLWGDISGNVVLGQSAGNTNMNGSYNVIIGNSAANAITTGYNNVFVGSSAGNSNSTGQYNTFIGNAAGQGNVGGFYNIAIGANSYVGTNQINSIAIGQNASVLGSNMLALGGTGVYALNVGIGTETPQNRLDVVGGARIRNLSTSGAVFANASGDLFVSAIGGILGAGTQNGITFWSTNSTITADGNNFIWDRINAKLRIGTSGYGDGNPRVHIYDNRTLSGGGLIETIRLAAGGTSFGDGPLLNFQSAYGGFTPGSFPDWITAAIGSPYSGSYQGDLTFYTNNGTVYSGSISSVPGMERMRITSQGNVGIGTNVPSNTLDVNGGARIRNLSTSGAVFANSNGDLYIGTSGVGGLGATNGVAFWANSTTLTANGSYFVWDNVNSKLRIGTSGYGNGNPRVHIYDDRTTAGGGLVETIRLAAGGTSFGDGPLLNFQSAYGGFTPGSFPEWITAAIGSPYSGSYQGDLTFYTNNGTVYSGSIATVTGMERMRITSQGNVGIATSTPTLAAFQVEKMVGNTVATFKNTGNSAGISLVTDWPGIFFNSYYNVGTYSMSTIPFVGNLNFDPYNGDFLFSTAPTGGTANALVSLIERMRISNNGTVNIGGELNRNSTSDANLVPIAYANVNANGTLNTAATTSNVSLSSHSIGSGNYYFTIAGESISYLSYAFSATLNGNVGFITTNSAGGLFYVGTFNTSGNSVDFPFSFIIYKK